MLKIGKLINIRKINCIRSKNLRSFVQGHVDTTAKIKKYFYIDKLGY